MGLQVPFAPYLLVFFFFVTVTIYLERLKLIKLIKQNKTQTLQWKHTKIAVQMTLGPYWNTFRSALLTIAYWLVVTSGLHCTFVYCTYQKLCRICWKRKTICFCYCLRLTEVCKRRLRINWTTMSQVKLNTKGLCAQETLLPQSNNVLRQVEFLIWSRISCLS